MTLVLRQNDVIWRNYVKMTSSLCYNDVIITSCVQGVAEYAFSSDILGTVV